MNGESNTASVGTVVTEASGRQWRAALAANPWPVAVGTGVLFLLVAVRFGLSWELLAYLYLAGVSVVLAVIDLAVNRLPNKIVLPSYLAGGLLFLLPAVAAGEWTQYLAAWLGALGLFALYFTIAWFRPSGMGFGDVKLAGFLGLYLGWLGWGVLIVGAFVGFLAGAIVGVVLLALGKAGRQTQFPFGPSMLVGAWVAILWGPAIVDWYAGIVALGYTT